MDEGPVFRLQHFLCTGTFKLEEAEATDSESWAEENKTLHLYCTSHSRASAIVLA